MTTFMWFLCIIATSLCVGGKPFRQEAWRVDANDCSLTSIDQFHLQTRYHDANTCKLASCCWIDNVNNTSVDTGSCYCHRHVIRSATTISSDCNNYQGQDTCHGEETEYDPSSVRPRYWQTPPRSSTQQPPYQYTSSYQDYHWITGYVDIKYTDSTLKSAIITLMTFTRFQNLSDQIEFQWNGREWNKESSQTFDANSQHSAVTVAARIRSLNVRLHWQNPIVNAPFTENGQKGAIVELFGWPYKDIKEECSFLGKAGYMGVKVFPPNEHVFSDEWLQNGELNPWYFIYQPVSYKLQSRMGSRQELIDMITTCRKNNVRVYADAVVNHMTGGANDVLWHRRNDGGCTQWGAKSSTAGSPYYTHSWTYGANPWTKNRPSLEYPAIPYFAEHFHCERTLGDWNSGFQLNAGWLVGLSDLNTEKEYVQKRIAAYFTDLLSVGFSGFRMDAAKHIRPQDLADIFSLLKHKMGGSLPEDFITYLEVIMGGEKDLLACNENSGYNYYKGFESQLRAKGLSETDIDKIKIWDSTYPKEFPICGNWVIPASRLAICNDDHDSQNPGSSSRDMGDKGSILLKERNVDKHRMFEKQLFDRREADWKIKLILSGYTFMNNGAQGFPDGYSDCSRFHQPKGPFQRESNCRSVPFSQAFDDTSQGYDVFDEHNQWKEGVYTRVHRDESIIRSMRNWIGMPSNALDL